MQRIAEAGIISEAGILRIPMDRLRQFFSENKGKRVVAEFTAVERGTTEAQWGYYRKYVVPTIRKAFEEKGELYSTKEVEEKLLDFSPVAEGKEIKDSEDFVKHIKWLQRWAAEHLSVYVEDPKII